MNYKKIYYTDDLEDQLRIGKALRMMYDSDQERYVRGILDKLANLEEIGLSRDDLYHRSIYDYWAYGFSPDQEIYLGTCKKSHEEKSQYISWKERFLFWARLNRWDDMWMLEDKYEAYKLLKPYYKRELIKILTDEDYPQFLSFIDRHPVFVVKPLGLSLSMGVRKIDADQYSDKKALFNELLHVADEFRGDYSIEKSDFNGAVLEELIVQEKQFGAIHPDSVNAVRITTIRKGGGIMMFYPWIKVGFNHSFVASAGQGGFNAGIDQNTGQVNTDGYMEDGKTLAVHPDSGIAFKSLVMPEWQAAVEMTKEISLNLPSSINYVGWDLVYTDKGWLIMEGNYYGDMMWQMFLERGTKKEFGDLIGWQMNPEKPFWWQYNAKALENK